MAFWLPSACGVAPTPMKAPGLMSASVALTTPYTAALSVELHLHVAGLAGLDGERRAVHRLDRSANPHRLRLLRHQPMKPQARRPSRAREHKSPHSAHVLSSHGMHAAIGGMPKKQTVIGSSHRRREAVAADRDGGGFERAVLLLVGAGDENLGAGLELVLGCPERRSRSPSPAQRRSSSLRPCT